LNDLLDNLNSEQRRAVEAVDGPVLILAGAGSGKTRVLTVKIAYLIAERRIPPGHILAMTFTRKAAEEMRRRVLHLTGGGDGFWIGTFHSVFARILRWEAAKVGIRSDFVIYDKEDQERLVRQSMESIGISTKQVPPRMIASMISRAKNSLLSPKDMISSAGSPMEKTAGEVFVEYQKSLRAHQAFDYDDLITVPIELFRRNPDVLDKYRLRCRYLLVDEYQDTNRAQYLLVSELARAHRNLCVVGDDDQSIYGWRGADLRNILDFEKDFPETRVFRLEQNYRSTQNILRAAGSVVDRNVRRKKKTLWSDREAGERIDLLEVEDERAEAQAVLDRIREEVFRKKRDFHHFAVLYRTNAQSRAVEDALRRAGISYVIVGGVRFYERKEIKDILAYCRVVVNPDDALSLRRIVNFPVRGIGETSLEKISAWAAERGVGLFAALDRVEEIGDLPPRVVRNAKALMAILKRYASLKDEISAGELVHALVDEIGLLALYKDDASMEGQARLENLREFLNAVHTFTRETPSARLTDFLDQVALLTDVDSYDSNAVAVSLMTVHSAKGLEFPVVFIVGLEDGLFPLIRNAENPDDLEEERRLFYVAVTRAKEKVVLLHARSRTVFNSEQCRIPSRFLGEIDPAVLLTNIVAETPRPFRRFVRSTAGIEDGFDGPSRDGGRSRRVESGTPAMRNLQRVEHEQYGSGTVLSVEGNGPRQTCTVRFDDGTEKKFLMRFARLRTAD
jgi:DNA helicase II / ATP-dependent DNA helicase PcrA